MTGVDDVHVPLNRISSGMVYSTLASPDVVASHEGPGCAYALSW